MDIKPTIVLAVIIAAATIIKESVDSEDKK